jgi:uncharacterized protein YndB with AHSA1/START domain
MDPVRATLTFDLPRDRVFELIADLAKRPAFCDHFQLDFRLEQLEASRVGAGARFRAEAPRFTTWIETVIEEVEPPYRLYERGHCGRWGRIPTVTVWELVAGAGETSEVSVTFWTEPTHPIDIVRERLGARRWYRRQWDRALRRLRDLAERGETPEPLAIAAGAHLPV